MPPVVAVLGPSAKKADEPIPAPNGPGPRTLRAFSLQTATFEGPPEGAVIAKVDPQASRCRDGGRGPCLPLWQYLVPPRKRQTSPSRPPTGPDPGPCGLFPCKQPLSRDRRKGP